MRAWLTCSIVAAVMFAAGLAPSAASAAQAGSPPASDDPGYYFMLGKHLEGAGRVDEAIAAHKRAIELDPKSSELRAELAGVYARQNNALAAVEQAEAAIAIDPDDAEANQILGIVYAEYAERRQPIKKGDDPSTYMARAVAALEKGIGDGSDIGIDFILGQLYLQTGAFSKAIPLLKQVVDGQPSSVDAAVLLSSAQEGAGRIDDAAVTLKGLLQENPGSFRAQLRLAEVYEGAERWSDAADAYAAAQKMNARAALVSRRAVALLSANRATEAKTLISDAISSGKPEGRDPVLLYLLAESQRAAKDLDAAQATVQKLLTANSDDVRALHEMSLILQDRGDLKGAERTLRDLIARDPIDAIALNSLGYMLAERGEKLDEAVALVERALTIEPGNPSYLDSLGWAYFQQGRLELADTHLTQAAAKLRTNSVVQDHLGDLRFKQRRFADAADAWQRALTGDGQAVDRTKIEKKIRDARGRM